MKTTEQSYQFTLDARDPDTELLASMLHAEYDATLSSEPMKILIEAGLSVDGDAIATLIWYRIAERAKELRA